MNATDGTTSLVWEWTQPHQRDRSGTVRNVRPEKEDEGDPVFLNYNKICGPEQDVKRFPP